MPQTCSVCKHEDLESINQALLANESLRNIAEQFPLSTTALHRHKKSHLPAALVKAQEAQEVSRADSLLDQLRHLQGKALSLLEQAETAGDLRAALQGVREAKGCLELLAKLQGDLQEGTIINILVSPAWVSLRSVILRALEPYPEARGKLTEALRGVDHAGD